MTLSLSPEAYTVDYKKTGDAACNILVGGSSSEETTLGLTFMRSVVTTLSSKDRKMTFALSANAPEGTELDITNPDDPVKPADDGGDDDGLSGGAIFGIIAGCLIGLILIILLIMYLLGRGKKNERTYSEVQREERENDDKDNDEHLDTTINEEEEGDNHKKTLTESMDPYSNDKYGSKIIPASQ